jgi:hypothetical protein
MHGMVRVETTVVLILSLQKSFFASLLSLSVGVESSESESCDARPREPEVDESHSSYAPSEI